MDTKPSNEPWIVLGPARLENLAYRKRERGACINTFIALASAKLKENGCAQLLPLKVAADCSDDVFCYRVHLTSGFRPAGQNGAFHFAITHRVTPKQIAKLGEKWAQDLASAARHYLQFGKQWAKDADEAFQLLNRAGLPSGFTLFEVAVCADASGQSEFSAEFETLGMNLQTMHARIMASSKEELEEKMQVSVNSYKLLL